MSYSGLKIFLVFLQPCISLFLSYSLFYLPLLPSYVSFSPLVPTYVVFILCIPFLSLSFLSIWLYDSLSLLFLTSNTSSLYTLPDLVSLSLSHTHSLYLSLSQNFVHLTSFPVVVVIFLFRVSWVLENRQFHRDRLFDASPHHRSISMTRPACNFCLNIFWLWLSF